MDNEDAKIEKNGATKSPEQLHMIVIKAAVRIAKVEEQRDTLHTVCRRLIDNGTAKDSDEHKDKWNTALTKAEFLLKEQS